MNELKFLIKQEPIAQPRPRVTKWGTFDPAKEKKAFAKLQLLQQISSPILSPILLDVTFNMPIPKNTSQKIIAKMLSNEIKHQKNKDLDNLLKYLMDVMNNIAFLDDKQVWKIIAQKSYSLTPNIQGIIHY